MATDHRGRGLHAGKRTAQELGWSYIETESGGYGAGTRMDPWRGGGANMGGMSATNLIDTDNPRDESMWVVNKSGETPGVSDLPRTETDLGRGKTMRESSTGGRVIVGTAKTPARAMIAAEAMNKRINEGRDLKTGRPKDSTKKAESKRKPGETRPGDANYPTALAAMLTPPKGRRKK